MCAYVFKEHMLLFLLLKFLLIVFNVYIILQLVFIVNIILVKSIHVLICGSNSKHSFFNYVLINISRIYLSLQLGAVTTRASVFILR